MNFTDPERDTISDTPKWSPDGKYIIFTLFRDLNIHDAVQSETSATVKLLTPIACRTAVSDVKSALYHNKISRKIGRISHGCLIASILYLCVKHLITSAHLTQIDNIRN